MLDWENIDCMTGWKWYRARILLGNQYINPFSSLQNLRQTKKYYEKETGGKK
jgi:hypothetical protein